MKSLILNTSDLWGGAHIATYRLHRGLINQGVDSTMYVQKKVSDDNTVNGPSEKYNILYGNFRPYIDNIPNIFYKKRIKEKFSSAILPNRSVTHAFDTRYDILHLFWVTDGFMRIESLKKVNNPVVWTLHDMWPFTGGCHYDNDCGKYIEKCGTCPTLGSASKNDISRKVWERKFKSWKNLNLTIVATSEWLAKCARNSSLFGDLRIEVIPNGIDTERYKPIDKKTSREVYNLPVDKKLILFASLSPTKDKRKGFQFLRPAINKLKQDGALNDVELVIVGTSKPELPLDLDIKVHFIPRLYDELSQVLLYSAADITILPSIQENLSNTVIESMACGTPVIAFDIGGMPDMIKHEFNGYLAKPFDVDSLSNGITWILNNLESKKISDNAREYAVTNYKIETVSGKYFKLYQDILK